MNFTNPAPDGPGVFLNPDADRFKPSVIRRMTLKADEIPGAINLSQGMPNFDPPDFVKAAAIEAITAGHNQYAPPIGIAELRQAVAAHSAEQLGYWPDPEQEVTITCGATEAMYVAILSLTSPGDRVVIPAPYYENYWADCVLAKLKPQFVSLRPPDWRLDLDELREAFEPKLGRSAPRAVILCNPNNPTGTVYTRKELEVIAELCRKHNAVAITDEVYEHIVYDGRRHYSIASFEGMRDRSVTISSASKTFSVTGWRVGTVIASPKISAVIRQAHDYVTIAAPRPFQHAVVKAFTTAAATSYYAEFTRAYQARRDLLYNALTQAGFAVNLPEGAYYLLADISDSGLDDVEFAERMLSEVKVAAVPASCFFDDESKHVGRRYVRFCFCKTDAALTGAAERLSEWNYRV